MIKQEELKKIVAFEALKYIKHNSVVGIGTGTTIKYFIEALRSIKNKIKGVVVSSECSLNHIQSLNIKIFDLNELDSIDIYIDSADEINHNMQMIKGGGGALTREKIIAEVAKTFVCIVDVTKLVNVLGSFPLPIEIIPMARNLVVRKIAYLGGKAVYRRDVITDNNNIILDVYNLSILEPIKLEKIINNIPGVVTVGLFSCRKADIALISTKEGIKIIN